MDPSEEHLRLIDKALTDLKKGSIGRLKDSTSVFDVDVLEKSVAQPRSVSHHSHFLLQPFRLHSSPIWFIWAFALLKPAIPSDANDR